MESILLFLQVKILAGLELKIQRRGAGYHLATRDLGEWEVWEGLLQSVDSIFHSPPHRIEYGVVL